IENTRGSSVLLTCSRYIFSFRYRSVKNTPAKQRGRLELTFRVNKPSSVRVNFFDWQGEEICNENPRGSSVYPLNLFSIHFLFSLSFQKETLELGLRVRMPSLIAVRSLF